MTGEEFLEIGSKLRMRQIEIEARLFRLTRQGKAPGDSEFDRLSENLAAVSEQVAAHMERYRRGL